MADIEKRAKRVEQWLGLCTKPIGSFLLGGDSELDTEGFHSLAHHRDCQALTRARAWRPFVFFFLFVAFSVATSGCLVKEACYTDADCSPPEVCRDHACVFECSRNEDCDADFGREYVCRNNHCVYPAECASCEFPNAESICIHGECSMGPCRDGYHDIDGREENGCEYACSTSNGGVEACDERDNDCDGLTDEGFDLSADVENCGRCGNSCPTPPNAESLCVGGSCSYVCLPGWYDNNRLPDDGCEATDCQPTEEVCDGQDNDCDCPGDTDGDGAACDPGDEGVDEGFDKTSPETCGDYCARCDYENAVPLCVEGACRMGECLDGWYDANSDDRDGCECQLTNGGTEACDGVDNDCDGLTDEDGACGIDCPDDMVPVAGRFCMDKYEASRPDATATNAGRDESRATSRPGVLPWMVNPMSREMLSRFQQACNAAGKRLCTKEEWYQACAGSTGTTYSFGNSFDAEVCNCVDSFCDDYCRDNGIPEAECNTGTNCGYDYYCFHVVPTGSFPLCVDEYGAYDVNGNVWEVVPSDDDPRGYEVRGGAFNCASPSVRLQCSFNAGWDALYAGFRCCKEPGR